MMEEKHSIAEAIPKQKHTFHESFQQLLKNLRIIALKRNNIKYNNRYVVFVKTVTAYVDRNDYELSIRLGPHVGPECGIFAK